MDKSVKQYIRQFLNQHEIQEIQSVLDQFPFQAVHHSLMAIGRPWPVIDRVPTVDELHDTAEELLIRVVNDAACHDGTITCTMRGLRASRYHHEDLAASAPSTRRLVLECTLLEDAPSAT